MFNIYYIYLKPGLPTPKHAEAMIEETDELEDLVKPKPSQVADIVKPAPKKHKQPVKITIPALPVFLFLLLFVCSYVCEKK